MTASIAGNENSLGAHLRALRGVQPAFTAVALATHTGLLLAADADDGTSADTLAAFGADLLISVQAPSRALAGGDPREASMRGPNAHVIALTAGESAVLVAMTDALTPASSVLPDLREAAEVLAEGL